MKLKIALSTLDQILDGILSTRVLNTHFVHLSENISLLKSISFFSSNLISVVKYQKDKKGRQSVIETTLQEKLKLI